MDYTKSKLYNLICIEALQDLLECNLDNYRHPNTIFRNNYRCFINERKRLLEIPNGQLKEIQRKINKLLSTIQIPNYIHNSKGKSNITNALVHKDTLSKIAKLDIIKFFPSTSRDKVYKFWKNKMNMSGCVANIITNLTTITIPNESSIINFLTKNEINTYSHLPTGSPTSPLLSFLVNSDMFEEIYEVVKKYDGKISIFADDITVSGATKIHNVYYKIRSILFSNGYRVSNIKSHIHIYNKKIIITGVQICNNNDIRVPNYINKKLKDLKKTKIATKQNDMIIKGIKNYQKQVNKYTKEK